MAQAKGLWEVVRVTAMALLAVVHLCKHADSVATWTVWCGLPAPLMIKQDSTVNSMPQGCLHCSMQCDASHLSLTLTAAGGELHPCCC